MEPAMVLCATIALASLVPPVLRSRRWAATAAGLTLVMTALVAAAAPSVADPLPPIVRLAEVERQPEDSAKPPTEIHEVVRGDSLWRIASAKLGARTSTRPPNAAIAGFWPRIYERNRPVIGDDPNLILPGQRLEIPAS